MKLVWSITRIICIMHGLSDSTPDSNQYTRIRMDQVTEPWALFKMTRQVQVNLYNNVDQEPNREPVHALHK